MKYCLMTALKADSVTKQRHQMDNPWLYPALKENSAGHWSVSIPHTLKGNQV